MATPKMPLHTPIPSEIKGLEVKHFYGRAEVPAKTCSVLFKGNQITVNKPDTYNGTVTFCSPQCIEVLEPQHDVDDFSINIRHNCVEGWRMTFSARDKEVIVALKDAITRTRSEQIMSANLLLDDRCRHLKLKTSGYTDEQVQRMREETTPPLLRGTEKEFKTNKWLSGPHVHTALSVVNACPAMSLCSTKACYMENLRVESGVVTCLFDGGMTVLIEASEYHPPRLVTPSTAEKQIYVCDSRDIWNPRQAWVFMTDRAKVSLLLPALMHAWMEVAGGAPKAKKDTPKEETIKAPATTTVSKRGSAKTVSKSAPAPKPVKIVAPTKVEKKRPARAAAPKQGAETAKSVSPPKTKIATPKKVEKVETPAKVEAPKRRGAAKTETKATSVPKTVKIMPKRKTIAKKTRPTPKIAKSTPKKVAKPAKSAATKRGGATKKVSKKTTPSKVVKIKQIAVALNSGARTSSRSKAAKAKYSPPTD